MKVKNDHYSKFSNLNNWKEETGFKPVSSTNTGAMLYQLSYEILTSSGWGLEKNQLSWKQFFVSCWRVSCRAIILPSFTGLHCKLAKIALFIYLIQFWVECMMSSAISFVYFTHFLNLNISGPNADIWRRFMAFLFFHWILCETGKNHRVNI